MSDPSDRIDSDEPADGPPSAIVDDAERLTRLARTAPTDAEADQYITRRDQLLADHEFTARVRTDDGDAVLVLHPKAWHDGDVIRTDRIEDLSRAIEIPLEGTGDPDDWAELDAHNRALATAVRDEHGDVHGDNADALADFVGNHYAKRIESLTAEELAEFRTEYFIRNAWPSERQRATIDDSIALVFQTADTACPEYRSQ